MSGILYLVATPIGNLEDITARAARILSEVSVIACEDTRESHKLLDRLGIRKPLLSCHEHNERARSDELVAKLHYGESIALISDAGSPLVSDPGYRLVDAALAAGITVVPIPGPSALITALTASGLETDAFYFGGFLPPKTNQRRKILESLAELDATLIFYESPHRILESLGDVAEVLGARRVVVARELTKMHEEFLRGTAADIRDTLAARPSVKGEITLLIAKADAQAEDTAPIPEAVAELVAAGISRMDAMKAVARRRGISKREVYKAMENA